MHTSIIVHGGAGVLDPERIPRCREGVAIAARAGWAILDAGGSALDAVEAAVRVLEDDGEFNAGYGAVLNRDGVVEVDAAIMDGALRAGAVAAVPWLRHPVTLARRVLEEGRHILLAGDGALAFAREHGIGPELPGSMITPRARGRWEEEKAGRVEPSATGDTVGATARDRHGGIAVACSTGGISYKRPGRVGDSPLVGAGLYALDGAGAATATGHGESILRVVMCKAAVDALASGAEAGAAATAAIEALARNPVIAREGHTAGVILVDARGSVAQARNAQVMPWAAIVDGRAEGGA